MFATIFLVVFFLALTPNGRELVFDTVIDKVNNLTPVTIHTQGCTSRHWSRLTCELIVVLLPDEEEKKRRLDYTGTNFDAIEIENSVILNHVVVHWHPFQLLQRHLKIDKLHVDKLYIDTFKIKHTSSGVKPQSPPSLISNIDIRRLPRFDIDNISISQLLSPYLPLNIKESGIAISASLAHRGEGIQVSADVSEVVSQKDLKSDNRLEITVDIANDEMNQWRLTYRGGYQDRSEGWLIPHVEKTLKRQVVDRVAINFSGRAYVESSRITVDKNTIELHLEPFIASQKQNTPVNLVITSEGMYDVLEPSKTFVQSVVSIDQTQHPIAFHANTHGLDINAEFIQFPLHVFGDLLWGVQLETLTGKVDANMLKSSLRWQAVGEINGRYSDEDLYLQFAIDNHEVDSGKNARFKHGVVPSSVKANTQPRVHISDSRLTWGAASVVLDGYVDLDDDQNDLRLNAESFSKKHIETLMTFQGNFKRKGALENHSIPSVSAMFNDIDIQENEWALWFGGELKNPVIELTADAGLYVQSYAVRASINAKLDERILSIHHFSLNAENHNVELFGQFNTRSKKLSSTFSAENIPFDYASFIAVNVPKDIQAFLSLDGQMDWNVTEPWRTALSLSTTLAIDSSVREIPVNTKARLSLKPNQFVLEDNQWFISSQPVGALSFEMVGERLNGNANIQHIPKALLSVLGAEGLNGELSVQAALKGSVSHPIIDGGLELKAPLVTYTNLGDKQEDTHSLRVDFVSDKSSVQGSIALHRPPTDKESLAVGEAVFLLDAQPLWNVVLQKSKTGNVKDVPIKGQVQGELALDALQFFVNPDLHSIGGVLSVDIQSLGTFASPEVKGEMFLKDGYYSENVNGFSLRDIQCAMSSQQARITFTECFAKDLESGKMSLNGIIELPVAGEPGLIDMGLSLISMQLIQRRYIESQATGSLTISGDFSQSLLSGALEIRPFAATISNSLLHNIPAINVTEYASREAFENSRQEIENSRSQLRKVALNIELSAQQQAYLRGKGVDAELQGQVRLKGTLAAPVVTGEFKTLRGEFEVFGKRFNLEFGKVLIANDAVNFEVVGVYQKLGQTIRATLAGDNKQQTLSLTSDPVMPEDEILAYLIFGKSLLDMTPLEGLQLAVAIQKLRSDGGGFDPIGRSRDLLGLDSLSIANAEDEEGNSGVVVGVGKYINERVYLEFERTPNPSQPWRSRITIELAPNIELESATGGGTGVEGAELKWKKDY